MVLSLTIKQTIFMVVLVLLSSLVYPHAKLDTTKPRNGEVLAESPDVIEVSFGKSIRLTKVILQHDKVEAISLDLSDYQGFNTHFSFPNPLREIGVYKVKWRGLAEDGHVMRGEFVFSVE